MRLSRSHQVFVTYISWLPRASKLSIELLRKGQNILIENGYYVEPQGAGDDAIVFKVKNPLRYFPDLYKDGEPSRNLSALIYEVRKVIPNIEDVSAIVTIYNTGLVLIKCENKINEELKDLAEKEILYNLNSLLELLEEDLSTRLWLWSTKQGNYAIRLRDLPVRKIVPDLARRFLYFSEDLFTAFENEISHKIRQQDLSSIQDRVRNFSFSFSMCSTSFLELIRQYLEESEFNSLKTNVESLQRRVDTFVRNIKEYISYG